MNILFLYGGVIDPEKGGVQRVTSVLADYFENQGHHVWYLSLKKVKQEVLHPVRQIMFVDFSSFDVSTNREQFTRVLLEKEIDILINQGALGIQTIPLVILAKQKGVKVISVLHNAPLAKIIHFEFSFATRIKDPFKFVLKFSRNAWVKYLLLRVYKLKYGRHFTRLCQQSDRVLLLSEKFKKELFHFTDGKVYDSVLSMPNPVSFNDIYRHCEKQKELVYVGRVNTEQKRVDLLLQIWSKLCQQYSDWKLTIIGSGEQLDEMKAYSIQLGLQNISFEGFQNPVSYYKRAAIFCMTSSYEGFAMVLMEAMHYGVVPFAFNSFASVTDIIDDQTNGYLVTPFDVDEYACKLELLMQNHELREAISQNAIVKSKEFSIEIIGQRWIVLMNELLCK